MIALTKLTALGDSHFYPYDQQIKRNFLTLSEDCVDEN